MVILLAIISVILFILLVMEKVHCNNVMKEINYLSNRLSKLKITSENGFVLLPTEHAPVKELASAINELLQDFYRNRAEYERSKKTMAQVLTNISHDIRTPLTVIKGNSEILNSQTSKMDLPEKVRGMIGKIDEKADELIETINEYFTMSKLNSGDMPLKLQRENLSQICHDTILDYYDLLEQKHFEVELQINDSPVFANVDAEALKRILKNLMDNAVRHGSDGKYIALRLVQEKGKTVIEVEDHGKGISAQQQQQIFFRNFTTAPKSLGNGLGLAIAKNLVLQMDGDLQVMSIPNDKTVFSVILKS